MLSLKFTLLHLQSFVRKMKVLKSNQFTFTICGFDSVKDKPKTVQFLNQLHNIVLCLIESSGVILSFLYAIINRDDLAQFVAGTLSVCCFSFANGMMYNSVFQKEKYRNLVNSLQNLVKKSEWKLFFLFDGRRHLNDFFSF